MAPYNLSDLAVKELKIPAKDLAPSTHQSFTGKFLLAHFLDFWALYLFTTLSVGLFQGSLSVFLNTKGLRTAYHLVDFSPVTLFAWGAFAFTYFFFSYYFNHGQTWGMKVTKCRISLKHHDASGALRWAAGSLSLYLSLGLSFRKVTEILSSSGKILPHDHLWQDLMVQKEVSAPDVMELVKEEEIHEVAEAA